MIESNSLNEHTCSFFKKISIKKYACAEQEIDIICISIYLLFILFEMFIYTIERFIYIIIWKSRQKKNKAHMLKKQ